MINLNKEQLNAVMVDAPLVVVATPGSGKTATIIERIKYNVEARKMNPKRILALSFTVAAANEIKERSGHNIESRTIHSWSYMMLRRKGLKANVVSENTLEKFSKSHSNQIYDKITKAVNFLRLGIIEEDEFEASFLKIVRSVKYKYENFLKKNNLIDFSDMLTIITTELKNQSYKDYINKFYDEIIIDEAQDLDKAQMEIIRMISDNFRKAVIVGDPDQSIYGFIGALSDIEDISSKFSIPKIILNQTYRFGDEVSKVAESIIARSGRNTSIARNNLHTDVSVLEDNHETTQHINHILQNGYFKPQDVAVLCRTNVDTYGVSSSVEYDVFLKTADKIRPHIPYIMNLVNFNCRQDLESLKNLLLMIRGIGEKTANKMCEKITPNEIRNIMNNGIVSTLGVKRKSILDQISAIDKEIVSMKSGYFVPGYSMFQNTPETYFQVIDAIAEKKLEEAREILFDSKLFGLTALTIHASKGLEFPVAVVLTTADAYKYSINDYNEEIRIAYVASTRAKDYLVINKNNVFLDHLEGRNCFV